MAEATGLRNSALPYPVYGAPYGIAFPIFDADGDLVTGAASLDSEISKNGDTFADCTNEATEIATSSGMYYLLLTGTEMTADVVTIIVKTSTSGAKTTPITLYPRKLVSLATGTSQGGAVGYITLAASTVLLDDQFNGCLCVAVIDSVTEARILQDCTASNQQCTVSPEWNTAPDADDTYTIYLPEGRQLPTVNVKAISDDTTAADNEELMFDGTGYAGGTAKLSVNASQISGDSTAADTLELFAEALDQSTGQLDSGSFASGTVASAADVSDQVWDEILSGHSVSGSSGEALAASGTAADPWATALPGAYAGGTAGKIIGDRLAGTIAAGTHNPQSGDAYARLGAPAGASVSADVAAVKAETASILTDTGTTLDTKIDSILDDTGTSGVVLATDAVSAASIKSDAVVEIAAGVATSAVKKNTQLANFMFHMRLSSSNANATGKTIVCTRSIDGAAFGSCANSPTEVANGWYKITLAATDLNGDVIALRFSETDCWDTCIALLTKA